MPVIEHVIGGPRPEQIMRDTWGHLGGRPDVKYRGTITFAEGVYGGERIILNVDFGNASDGPWFYEGVHDWLFEQDTEPGYLYRFEGCYRQRRGETHEFTGTIERTSLHAR
jgi:hypothetical protein